MQQRIRRYVSKFLYIITIACFVFVGAVYYYTHRVYLQEDTTVLIKPNSSVFVLADTLYNAKVIKHKVLFIAIVKFRSKLYGATPQAGEYVFNSGMNMVSIINKIMLGKVKTYKITVPEGYTTHQILELLKIDRNIAVHTNLDTLQIKEGEFLPQTYLFTRETTDAELIMRMKKAQEEFLAAEWEKRDKKIDNLISTPYEALILASIVEKETGLRNEKPLIAGVYLNRLKKKMRLQADPTVVYGLTEGKKPLNRKLYYSDLKSPSQHNTYTNAGLIPTPICNPGEETILAVLHPSWSNYLYFVSQSDGTHSFSQTFGDHKKNIAQRDIDKKASDIIVD